MTYEEAIRNARGNMGNCHACPVCDGRGCRNTIPGPGAKGSGTVAIRNYEAWQKVCLNMDTICEGGPVDTGFTLFGQKYDLPVFAGPVGAVKMHYGDKFTDEEYNAILVPACAKAGIAAFTGDGNGVRHSFLLLCWGFRRMGVVPPYRYNDIVSHSKRKFNHLFTGFGRFLRETDPSAMLGMTAEGRGKKE